jgi:hypothetical protein
VARIVSDEVWAQLDHRAGRLPRRTARRLTAAVGALLTLIAVASVVWEGGLVVAHLSANEMSWGWSWDPPRSVFVEVRVRNDGWLPVTMVDVGGDVPGLRFVGAQQSIALDPAPPPPFPIRLAPGEEAIFNLRYEVTDCTATARSERRIPVRVGYWWGEAALTVDGPGFTENAPSMYSYQGVDPYEVGWAYHMAGVVCGRIEH